MKKIYSLLLFLFSALCGPSLQAMEHSTMLVTVRYHRHDGIHVHNFRLYATAKVSDLQQAIAAKLRVPENSIKVMVTKTTVEVDPNTKKKLSVEYRKLLNPSEGLGNDETYGVPIVQEHPAPGQPGFYAQYTIGYVPPVYDAMSTTGLADYEYPILFRQTQPLVRMTKNLIEYRSPESNDFSDFKRNDFPEYN